MADRYKVTGQDQLSGKQSRTTIISHAGGAPLRKKRSPDQSTQLRGFLALLISTGILLVLSGTTITTAVISFIFFAPVIINTSPIWVPTFIFIFFSVATVLAVCGLGLAAAGVLVVQSLIKAWDDR